MTSRFSPSDYAAAALALRPRGTVWPDDPASVQAQAFGGLTASLARTDGDAVALLVDAFPSTTLNLLPEWEASLGLPDVCAGPNQTIPQRQSHVRSRFFSGGGQSVARYIAYAASLGFTVTIVRYTPFRVDINRVEDALYSDEWAYAIGVVVQANPGGQPIAVLACEMATIVSAQTLLSVQYAAGVSGP